MGLEVKNPRLNHKIPDETFIIEIPDGSEIRALNRYVSKEEFLKLYGSAFNEE